VQNRGTLKRLVTRWPKDGQFTSAQHVNDAPALETSTICPCESVSSKSSANQIGH
jgi:hypothetical protein